ncbi:YsnF/AvaK domain-containing protein [Rubellimicrobium sp. CFH 75288]|uniref:YsnF/AvaK domain-containing protein n=1 Tax=Rubellimicrobium sp. CFH 75288 TaxID=2697034 RepID=UPI0014131F1A|nr:YsnF/AvaK domain-containing protein [Rubellimicrobium sp. CFH 75288]NAZ36267.1 DUF2382 domain-containing protein [Rubellimicrobium sp. CFH 75288]
MDTTYSGSRTLTAMFDSAAEAERAVARLRQAGVAESAIRYTPGYSHEGGTRWDYSDPAYRDDPRYRETHKGFWESLGDFFFPEEDRYTYAEGLSRGSHMVAVTGYDPVMEDTIIDILDDEGSVDLDSRESEWRSSGWGYEHSDYYRGDSARAGMSAAAVGVDLGARGIEDQDRGTIYDDGMRGQTQMAADMGRRDMGRHERAPGETVEVVEEQLAVGKRAREGGRVRVRSYVREEPVSAEVDLRSTRVYVERRPVDRPAEAADFRDGERVIEAREYEEEAVVSKEARVVEEIALREESEVRHETVTDTVRKTEVEIEDDRTGETTRLSGERDRY